MLKNSPIAEYLRDMNGLGFDSYHNYPDTSKGNQGIFRIIWTFLTYKGGNAVYSVGSSYISRLLNDLYQKYWGNKEEEEECAE